LDYFTARSDGKVITLEWKSIDESYISGFEIDRAGSNHIFAKISDMDAKGYSASYKYVDEDAFMKAGDNNNTQSNNIFYYQLKIIKKDNTALYSNEVNVTHNISGIRRTWGMIKEMFR
jgi:hypothetical protein